MIVRVHIVEDFQTMGHRVIVVGRQHPGAPTSYLTGAGKWEQVPEAPAPIDASHSDIGFVLPEGALDAIVHEHLKVAAPNTATERHLNDALAVRDRLLSIVERPEVTS